MLINKNTFMFGTRCLLVPYRKHHVPKYHAWMQDAELQELTASEPLSLDQEYAMQQSWLHDDNKCTFIVLDLETYNRINSDEIGAMVGDVNLFFNDPDDKHVAEVEVMIAEKASRGKGLGREATLAMMFYGIQHLGVTKYSVKIGYSNQPSINMFHKLHFQEVSRSDVFEEVTLEMHVTNSNRDWLMTSNCDVRMEERPS